MTKPVSFKIVVALLSVFVLAVCAWLIVSRVRGHAQGREATFTAAEKQAVERSVTAGSTVTHYNPNLPPDVPRLPVRPGHPPGPRP